jgi:hypothetical protein
MYAGSAQKEIIQISDSILRVVSKYSHTILTVFIFGKYSGSKQIGFSWLRSISGCSWGVPKSQGRSPEDLDGNC